jgi:ubiquinol-cytochrome c reductase cytochrome c1 subunit
VQGTGTMSSLEYDKSVADLANYMNYMAEPARLERRTIGFYVLMVLGLLLLLVYALKKSYWKEVH